MEVHRRAGARPAQVELRVLGGRDPFRARPAGLRRLGGMLALVLSWQAADAVLYAAAAQGQLSAALGGWAAAAGLVAALGIGVLRLR